MYINQLFSRGFDNNGGGKKIYINGTPRFNPSTNPFQPSGFPILTLTCFNLPARPSLVLPE